MQLDATEEFDAWLIAWGIDSTLGAHDHGRSNAAVHVLQGCLVEWYRDQWDHTSWNVREVTAGHTVTVPRARIHEVHQSGPEPAMSVHVYSPPLVAMGRHVPVQHIGAERGPQRAPALALRRST